jgi:hypothetical protein
MGGRGTIIFFGAKGYGLFFGYFDARVFRHAVLLPLFSSFYWAKGLLQSIN